MWAASFGYWTGLMNHFASRLRRRNRLESQMERMLPSFYLLHLNLEGCCIAEASATCKFCGVRVWGGWGLLEEIIERCVFSLSHIFVVTVSSWHYRVTIGLSRNGKYAGFTGTTERCMGLGWNIWILCGLFVAPWTEQAYWRIVDWRCWRSGLKRLLGASQSLWPNPNEDGQRAGLRRKCIFKAGSNGRQWIRVNFLALPSLCPVFPPQLFVFSWWRCAYVLQKPRYSLVTEVAWGEKPCNVASFPDPHYERILWFVDSDNPKEHIWVHTRHIPFHI